MCVCVCVQMCSWSDGCWCERLCDQAVREVFRSPEHREAWWKAAPASIPKQKRLSEPPWPGGARSWPPE